MVDKFQDFSVLVFVQNKVFSCYLRYSKVPENKKKLNFFQDVTGSLCHVSDKVLFTSLTIEIVLEALPQYQESPC